MYNFAEIKRNRKYTHFGILPNIMLYSASGALLANKQINTSHIELDVSTYSKGNYFAVIYINEKKTHWKIIKN